ncbi:putative deacetylase LmbE-like domain-containing protein [Fimicolochytrium jonesii]|uniref:putative deacetylase LmbE-like domain-containing protein n=1 Tax=Fimicolochytrium jonesii TaxID=1396493 RepID=UPI0022FDF3F4|nr:putative deacetylase LmbE-like domain-containing protein [Fimicolochytrium jonesii]KAI8823645.1 putative deacetylase LmbE-like domain-containing protein [Fimicolochytrium jonesii]
MLPLIGLFLPLLLVFIPLSFLTLFVESRSGLLLTAETKRTLFGSDRKRRKHSSGKGGSSVGKTALLLIAHPDDECMFFAPTVIELVKSGADVEVLCLSQGNADGLGDVRPTELVKSCKALGILDSSKVSCLDHAELQDDPNAWWKASVIADVLSAHIGDRAIEAIITFDQYGISGHANHRALFDGLRYFQSLPMVPGRAFVANNEDANQPYSSAGRQSRRLSSRGAPVCYALKSISILRKYSGVLDLPYTVLNFLVRKHILPHRRLRASSSRTTLRASTVDAIKEKAAKAGLRTRKPKTSRGPSAPTEAVFVGGPLQAIQGCNAMTCHKSQLVWFRYLYLLFSRYMVINELVEI